jgi:hypothetical protein
VTRVERERRTHHSVPRHVLARFSNPDGRLTVIRRTPEFKVLRRQAPENVGAYRRLYSWQQEDGTWNDELETGPLDRLDSAGASEIDEAIQFAIDHDAETHLRILDWPPEKRAPLQLFLAGLMVRTPELRDDLDAKALPTLLEQLRRNADQAAKADPTDSVTHDVVKQILDTPGRVKLDAPPLRHHALLIPLIEAVSMRLHLDMLVAVRRFSKPLLLTGSQPVVVFPSHDMTRGMASARFLSEGSDAIRMWDPREDLLSAVDARFNQLAGAAVALDPHTLLFMFNPDSAEGGKIVFASSQIPEFALAGIVNVMVLGGARWVAGRDDCEFIASLSRTQSREPSVG